MAAETVAGTGAYSCPVAITIHVGVLACPTGSADPHPRVSRRWPSPQPWASPRPESHCSSCPPLRPPPQPQAALKPSLLFSLWKNNVLACWEPVHPGNDFWLKLLQLNTGSSACQSEGTPAGRGTFPASKVLSK